MTTAYSIALAEISTAEFAGAERNNPRILEYFTSTELEASTDETPWCAAFVNWCLQRAGVEGTRSARAKSFLRWGRSILLDEAQQGDVVVFQNHVGFFAGRIDAHSIHVLGGNQSNRVSITRYSISSILSIRTMTNETIEKLAGSQPPSIWQWIVAAPTLIEKISRVIQTAQAKNLVTTIAALVALLSYVVRFFGIEISPEIQDAINAAALGIIGWFTGKQVINPTPNTARMETAMQKER